MKIKYLFLLAVALCNLFTGVNPVFGQGSLTPPGAPAPTMKTLDQIEPRTPIAALPFSITNAGSYYLTANLTGVAGQNGITITASGVTLDLMGFELAGVATSLDGINISAAGTNAAVRNGTVRNWSGDGVKSSSARHCQYQDLRLSNNGGDGLDCGPHSTVANCSALNNGRHGIIAITGATISSCTASFNTSRGITASSGNTISGCTATSNTDNGIDVSESSVISGCVARFNGAAGIVAGGGSTVSGCSAEVNTGDGIEIAFNSLVLNNACANNGFGAGNGAGIKVFTSGNRIEGNNVADNDRGIEVTAAGNLIIKNSARGNGTNYVFTGTQTFGPTNTITGEISAADAHPWRNFSF